MASSKSPVYPDAVATTLHILTPQSFLQHLVDQIVKEDFFTKDYYTSFLIKERKLAQLDQIKEKQKLEELFQKLFKDSYEKEYPVYAQSIIAQNLMELSEIYEKLKNDEFIIDKSNSNPEKFMRLKYHYAAIFELCSLMAEELLVVCAVIMDNLLELEFKARNKNVAYMLRNSFQHHNEILNDSQFQLFKETCSQGLAKYPRKKRDKVMKDNTQYFIFNVFEKQNNQPNNQPSNQLNNQPNTQLTFFSAVKFSEIAKFTITFAHLLNHFFSDKKEKRNLVFSHEYLGKLVEFYDIDLYYHDNPAQTDKGELSPPDEERIYIYGRLNNCRKFAKCDLRYFSKSGANERTNEDGVKTESQKDKKKKDEKGLTEGKKQKDKKKRILKKDEKGLSDIKTKLFQNENE